MAPAPLLFWSSFLVQSCACNVHPSCYVQLSFNIAMLLYSYSIIWTHYTIFSHATPAKCLSGFQFNAILMSVVVWTQSTFVVGVEILSHKVCTCSNRHCSPVCPWVSGEIWMTNTVCIKETKSNSYFLCKERWVPSTAVGSYIFPNIHGLKPDKKLVKCDCIWKQERTRGIWLTQRGGS